MTLPARSWLMASGTVLRSAFALVVTATSMVAVVASAPTPAIADATITPTLDTTTVPGGTRVVSIVESSNTNPNFFFIDVPEGGAVVGGPCTFEGGRRYRCDGPVARSQSGSIFGTPGSPVRYVLQMPSGVAKGEMRIFKVRAVNFTWTSPGSGTGLEVLGQTGIKPSPGGKLGTYTARLVNGSAEAQQARVTFIPPAGITVADAGFSTGCFSRGETEAQCNILVPAGGSPLVEIPIVAASGTAANASVSSGLKLTASTGTLDWDVSARPVNTDAAGLEGTLPTTTTTAAPTTTTTAAPTTTTTTAPATTTTAPAATTTAPTTTSTLALDSDGDGKPDAVEGTADIDGDGIPNYLDPDDNTPQTTTSTLALDSDGDGKPDAVEGTADIDGDGIPNHLDPDDNTPRTTTTVFVDSDGDGIPDHLDPIDGRFTTTSTLALDSDGDGKPDAVEGTADIDGDGIPNHLDPDDNTPQATTSTLALDSDGDGKPDAVEGTADIDGDGIPNHLDPDDNTPRTTTSTLAPLDSDGDGVPDSVEGAGDFDGDGLPNYLDPDDNTPRVTTAPNSVPTATAAPVVDTDGDGKSDSSEGTGDADGDGTPNYLDPDDNTPRQTAQPIIVRVPSATPATVAATPATTIPDVGARTLDADADTDGDGVPDASEGTGDTDGDGIPNAQDAHDHWVSGRVFVDENNDGALTAADSSPQTVNVELIGAGPDGVIDSADDPVVGISSKADFRFSNVNAGVYRLSASSSGFESGPSRLVQIDRGPVRDVEIGLHREGGSTAGGTSASTGGTAGDSSNGPLAFDDSGNGVPLWVVLLSGLLLLAGFVAALIGNRRRQQLIDIELT